MRPLVRVSCYVMRWDPVYWVVRWYRRRKFERAYAHRSGLTVAKLRGMGRVVVRCRCGEPECEGWASVSEEAARDYEPGAIYGP